MTLTRLYKGEIMNNRWRQKKKLNGYTFTKSQIWNADDTMAKFILAVLKEFKQMKRNSYPGQDEATATPEKWEALLDRMIYTFDQLANDFPDSPHHKACEKMQSEHPECWDFNWKSLNNGYWQMDFLHEDIQDQYMTDEVSKKEKEYREYIQEGLQLFAKYFQYLWN